MSCASCRFDKLAFFRRRATRFFRFSSVGGEEWKVRREEGVAEEEVLVDAREKMCDVDAARRIVSLLLGRLPKPG